MDAVPHKKMTKQKWANFWINFMDELGITDQEDFIHKAAEVRFGADIQFVPEGFIRKQLIELARKVGIKIDNNPDYCEGEEIPTVAGTFKCSLVDIRPSMEGSFYRNYSKQKEWVNEQGGDGLVSAEEALWLSILAYKQLGKTLFKKIWVRCRNTSKNNEGLVVGLGEGDALSTCWDFRSKLSTNCGTIPRDFMLLAS